MQIITLPEATAQGVFATLEVPDNAAADEGWHFEPCPTVRWLVVDEPLVCNGCTHGGFWFDMDGEEHNCDDCSATGRPTVEVASCSANDWVGESDITRGTVTIGPAVPIVGSRCPTLTNEPPIDHIHTSTDRIGQHPADSDFIWDSPWQSNNDITDEFGGQDVKPGRWAHPIIAATA